MGFVDETDLTEQVEDQELDEAQRRIALANYYMLLTKGGFFDTDSEEAKTVDMEVRNFARHRMAVLLNIKSEKSQELPPQLSEFTKERVEALVQLADRMLAPKATPQQQVVATATPVLVPKKVPPPSEETAVRKKKKKQNVDFSTLPEGATFEDSDGKVWKVVEVGGQKTKISVNGFVKNPHARAIPLGPQATAILEQQASLSSQDYTSKMFDKMMKGK